MTQKNPPRRFPSRNRDHSGAPKKDQKGDRPYRSTPRREGAPFDRPRRERAPFDRPRREGAPFDRPRRFEPNRERPAGERPFRPRFEEMDEKRQLKLRPRRNRHAPNSRLERPLERRPERRSEMPAEKPPLKVRTTPQFTKDEMRLNKFISNSGVCSRREADQYITAGLVTVNGEIITRMGSRVKPTDDIRFNGERLTGEEKVYILMNKPKDFVTTTDDPHAGQTVLDLIAEKCPQRVYPVGRLDKSTTGVLLLTNDGNLTMELTHPSYNRKKIYQVDLDKNLKKSDMEALVKGVELEDGVAQVDEISYVDENEKKIGVEIHSGRNRIIRRMFEHLGYEVKKLDRVYFAGLTKKRLRRGAWRFLTPKEVAMLKMGSYE